jgi:hypothetical protein
VRVPEGELAMASPVLFAAGAAGIGGGILRGSLPILAGYLGWLAAAPTENAMITRLAFLKHVDDTFALHVDENLLDEKVRTLRNDVQKLRVNAATGWRTLDEWGAFMRVAGLVSWEYIQGASNAVAGYSTKAVEDLSAAIKSFWAKREGEPAGETRPGAETAPREPEAGAEEPWPDEKLETAEENPWMRLLKTSDPPKDAG